jgi:flavin reductase (DIM6/NTAB) family NADH-FMN oxidoreductase RutF
MEISEAYPEENYLDLLRRYPTGVTVVSTTFEGRDYGSTMNSFTTVSMNPPLVAVFIMKGSRTLNAVEKSGKFVVSLLSGCQEEAARIFSQDSDENKFGKFRQCKTDEGIAYLQNSIGRIECHLQTSQDIADHRMIIGSVKNYNVHNQSPSLMYYRRRFYSTDQ